MTGGIISTLMSSLYERSGQHVERFSNSIVKRALSGNLPFDGGYASKISTEEASILSKTYVAAETVVSANTNGNKDGQNVRTDKSDEKWNKLYQSLLHKLSKIIELSLIPNESLELHHFSIKIFKALKILNLDQCPPNLIDDIFVLKDQLHSLLVVNSGVTDLDKIFIPFDNEAIRKLPPMAISGLNTTIPEQFTWSALVKLRLSNCGIVKIDHSMHFFPNLEYLDLSYNLISRIVHLQDCISLQYLNLSHNRIKSLSNLDRVLGRVTSLCVSYNDIHNLTGIEKLLSLEVLDASYNHLSDFSDIRGACRLPCLESICLLGNSLAELEGYRLKVYDEFLLDGSVMESNRDMPQLDGVPFSEKEKRKLKKVMFRSAIQTNLPQPTPYSFATNDDHDNHDHDGNEDPSPVAILPSKNIIEGSNNFSSSKKNNHFSNAQTNPSPSTKTPSSTAFVTSSIYHLTDYKKFKPKQMRGRRIRQAVTVTAAGYEEPPMELSIILEFMKTTRESLVAARIAAIKAAVAEANTMQWERDKASAKVKAAQQQQQIAIKQITYEKSRARASNERSFTPPRSKLYENGLVKTSVALDSPKRRNTFNEFPEPDDSFQSENPALSPTAETSFNSLADFNVDEVAVYMEGTQDESDKALPNSDNYPYSSHLDTYTENKWDDSRPYCGSSDQSINFLEV